MICIAGVWHRMRTGIFYACDQYPHGNGENVAVLRAGVWECAYYTLYNWVENPDFRFPDIKRNM